MSDSENNSPSPLRSAVHWAKTCKKSRQKSLTRNKTTHQCSICNHSSRKSGSRLNKLNTSKSNRCTSNDNKCEINNKKHDATSDNTDEDKSEDGNKDETEKSNTKSQDSWWEYLSIGILVIATIIIAIIYWLIFYNPTSLNFTSSSWWPFSKKSTTT